MSGESIKPPCAPNNSIKSASNTKSQVKLDGSCLKQDKVKFTHKKLVNIYIIHEINTIGKDFTLGKSLFEAVKLTKNFDFK